MRMSLNLLKLCVAVAVFAAVSQALAQGQGGQGGGRNRGNFGGGGRGGFVSPLMLLQIEPVQKELALSDDQKTSVTKLSDDARQARGNGGGGPPSQEEMQQRRDDQQKKISEILLPNQQERLDQIVLQLQGAQALSDPKVAEKLQLTDDQKTQLTKLGDDYQQKRRDLFQGGNRPDPEAMTKMRTEQNDKALEILTADQKDQFTKMEGTKFDIDPSLLRGGFGGQNGGGRRNRNGGNGGGGNGGNAGKGQPDA